MLQLRAAAAHGEAWQPPPCPAVAALPGWHPADPAHHCSWARVACNEQGRVTQINLDNTLMWNTSHLNSGLPAGSGSGGSNRSSGSDGGGDSGGGRSMALAASSGHGLLLPGLVRLPALVNVVLEVCDLQGSTLPPEWGQRGAFPSLQRCASQPACTAVHAAAACVADC